MSREIIDRFRPIGLEAIDQQLIEDQRLSHQNIGDDRRAAPSRPRRLAAGAVRRGRRQASGDRSLRVLADGRRATTRTGWPSSRASRTAATARTCGASARRGWPPPRSRRTARTTGPAGRTRRCRPDRCGDYLRDLQALLARHGLDGQFYGHIGQGCIHGRYSFDLRTAPGIANYRRSWRRRPISSSPTAGRCPASTATASSGPSCWSSSTGRSWWRRCVNSSASGTRPGR